jgi:hypothetical protein
MRDLSLQICGVNLVMIYHGDSTYASAAKIQHHWRSQATCADDQCTTRQNALLTLYPYIVQQYMSAVAQELTVIHGFFMPLGRIASIRTSICLLNLKPSE